MEHQNNFQAIISFLQSLELQTPINLIEDLVDGCAFINILERIEEFSVGDEKFIHAENWMKALSNQKSLVKLLKKFYQYSFSKTLLTSELDLVRLCKNKDREQISKLFFMILSTIVQSSAKQFFISKLLNLTPLHQAYFMQKIRISISDQQQQSVKFSKQYALLQTVSELQRQNQQLRVELNTISQQNIVHKRSIKQFQLKVQTSSIEIEKLRSHNEYIEKQKGKISNPKDLKIIETLKEKLRIVVGQHTKEIEKYKEEILVLSNQGDKISQLETLVETYKDNYEEAVSHLKQMSQWQQDKYKIMKQLQQNIRTIQDQQQSLTQLSDKIQSLTQQIIDLQVQNQKLTVRNNQLQIVKTSNNAHRFSVNLSNSSRTLSQILTQPSTPSPIPSLQLQKLNRKIQSLQKQNKKLLFKAQRTTQIQKQKSRLQSLIMQQHQSKLDEIQLLTTALYDLRMRYMQLTH